MHAVIFTVEFDGSCFEDLLNTVHPRWESSLTLYL
jgi:hypothetical protein